MLFRKAKIEDLSEIEIIFDEAKEGMKQLGIDQWQDGYPNVDVVREDISNGESYVVEVDGKVKATCMVSTAVESTYLDIEGQWINNDPCVVVHRIACKKDSLKLGIASYCIEQAFLLFPTYKNIKIDTHFDNLRMQSFLKKNGFIHCGTIYLENGDPRVAFQKSI